MVILRGVQYGKVTEICASVHKGKLYSPYCDYPVLNEEMPVRESTKLLGWGSLDGPAHAIGNNVEPIIVPDNELLRAGVKL